MARKLPLCALLPSRRKRCTVQCGCTAAASTVMCHLRYAGCHCAQQRYLWMLDRGRCPPCSTTLHTTSGDLAETDAYVSSLFWRRCDRGDSDCSVLQSELRSSHVRSQWGVPWRDDLRLAGSVRVTAGYLPNLWLAVPGRTDLCCQSACMYWPCT